MSFKEHRIVFNIIHAVLIIVLTAILLIVGMIGFLSLTEYKPQNLENMFIEGNTDKSLEIGKSISILSWNIGYGSLGDNADFFMDGGKSVMTATKERVNQNLDGILSEVKSINPDIVLFQEIDRNSTRSHHINEYEKFKASFNKYSFSFANNFKVAFLPYPVPPIGKVDSGLATASKYEVLSADRVQLPIPFSWPVRMANLKRCVLVSRIPIKGSDKQLVVFNLHLEAYDDGEGKQAQTQKLAGLLKTEANNGNYIIAGGDFNQIFSTADKSAYTTYDGMWAPGEIDVSTFGDGWQFFMDEAVPSCRSLDKAYAGADKENFQYYLIDGFIVSNNITVDLLETQSLNFENSDHNPVLLKITLNED